MENTKKDDTRVFWDDTKQIIDVIEMELHYGDKKKWYTQKNGEKAFYLVEDKSVIISEDFYRIPRNCCRSCKGDNSKPYDNIYYKELYGSFNHLTKIKYCFSLGYCEACAKKKAIKKRDPLDSLDVIGRKKWQLVGDQYAHYETELSDGSIIESCENYKNKCVSL